MTRYVALLRGINVGGNNLIKMADLKVCFEKMGFEDVATYIASGNVLFATDEAASEKLVRRIEGAIASTFGCDSSVVLRNRKQMLDVVRLAPDGFGKQPEKFRYDVIFLRPSLSAPAAIKIVPMKPGVDAAHAGTGVLYFSRLISKATQSRLGKIAALPMYKEITIRNWNTTTKLASLA